MTEITLFTGKWRQQVSFPATWADLLPEEVFAVCRILHAGKHVTEHIFTELLNMRMKAAGLSDRLRNRLFRTISVADASAALSAVDFIFNDPPVISKPNLCRSLVAPDFEKDMTVAEFEEISALLPRALKEPDIAATIAAILYRRRGVPFLSFNYKNNDYDTYKYASMVSRFMSLPPEKISAVTLWCVGQMHLAKKIFPEVFEGKGSGPDDGLAFTRCIHAAAGPKNGTRNQVRATPLYEFLFEMQQEAIKAKEIEELSHKT